MAISQKPNKLFLLIYWNGPNGSITIHLSFVSLDLPVRCLLTRIFRVYNTNHENPFLVLAQRTATPYIATQNYVIHTAAINLLHSSFN